MSPDLVLNFITTVGFPVSVAAYFLWRDLAREKAILDREATLNTRISDLEKAYAHERAELFANAIRVIERNTHVMERLERHLEAVDRRGASHELRS